MIKFHDSNTEMKLKHLQFGLDARSAALQPAGLPTASLSEQLHGIGIAMALNSLAIATHFHCPATTDIGSSPEACPLSLGMAITLTPPAAGSIRR